MNTFFSKFIRDEDGAITVDFVVMTAAICILGFLVLSAISVGAVDLTNDIVAALANVPVP